MFMSKKKEAKTETTDTESKKDVRMTQCPDCEGRGINPSVDEKQLCLTCDGSGKVPVS